MTSFPVFMNPIHSKIVQGTRTHFEKLVRWYGKKRAHSHESRKHVQLLQEQPGEIHRETNNLAAVGQGAWQSSALGGPTKTLSRDVAPLGDEPLGASGEDVKVGNDEDEEPEVPRARMNPKNPTRREKQ